MVRPVPMLLVLEGVMLGHRPLELTEFSLRVLVAAMHDRLALQCEAGHGTALHVPSVSTIVSPPPDG